MTAGSTRPGDGRRVVSAGAILAIAVAGAVVARLAPWDWLSVSAALVPFVIAGAAVATRLGFRLDAISLVPVGLVAATLVTWLVALAGYAIAVPTTFAIAVLGGLLVAGVGLAALVPERGERGAGRPAAARDERAFLVAIAGVAIAIVLLTAWLGPYYPAGFDSPFHTAVLRRLLESPSWTPPDPYFSPAALPVPQYGLGPWYPVLALLATIAGRDPMATLSGSVAPLAGVATLALAAMVRAAVLRAGQRAEPDPARRIRTTAMLAASLALATWIAWAGGVRAGLDWRLMLLPEQVGLAVLLPATLAALWSGGDRLAGRRLLVLGGLGALAAPTHMLAAGSLAAVLGGELVLGASRRERDTWLPASVVAVGLASGLALTAIPLAAMVAAVGADAFGQPGSAERLLHLGPFVALRPGLWLSQVLVPVGLAAAIVVLALGPRRSGAAGLAIGALGGWLVVALPPLANVVVATAGAMYLVRLVTVPVTLAVPLVGIAGAWLVAWGVRGARRTASGGVGRVVALAALAASVGLASVTALGTKGPHASPVPPWVGAAGRTAAARPDDRSEIRNLGMLLDPYLPPGSTVLAELATAYVLPAVLDVRVVAVPAVHSISTDARHVNAGGRTEAGDDALLVLRRRGTVEQRIAVLERYDVGIVLVDPRRSGADGATFAAEYGGRLTVVATDLGPDRLAVLEVGP